MSLIRAWINREKKQVIFINQIIPGGSLRNFLKKIKHPKLKVIKKWCIEILNGLDYLHSRQPNPIIHRDIKCDNIFIDSNDGKILIGDLGLATTSTSDKPAGSVLGTPEYMAPEIFQGEYTTKVDIYAFGMTLLEICTLESPYSECRGNPGKVYKKVCCGIKPKSLDLISDNNVRQFIDLCLGDVSIRPSAKELLAHEFLKLEDSEAENSVVKLNTYKKKPTKKPTNPKIDRTESKDNLAFILSDLSEPKPEPEVKKSKSVIFYPLHIELKSIDDEKFEFIIQNESSHTVLSKPRVS